MVWSRRKSGAKKLLDEFEGYAIQHFKFLGTNLIAGPEVGQRPRRGTAFVGGASEIRAPPISIQNLTLEKMMPLHSLKEAAVRARAKRLGYSMVKSRRAIDANNAGEFMLLEANLVVLGSRYDASAEQIAGYIES